MSEPNTRQPAFARAGAGPLEPSGSRTAGPEPGGVWSLHKFILVVALAAAAHVALIFAFGTKKPFVPRAVTNVPVLRFAGPGDELLELDNPALFALPNPRDFAAALWEQPVTDILTYFRYTEPPRWLAKPDPNDLGVAFAGFMQTNEFGQLRLDFKPAPEFAELASPADAELEQPSTLEIGGTLAQRRVLFRPALPALEWNDVLAPSRVQVLVSPAGDVLSAVPLPSDNPLEAAGRSPKGDTNAIALASSLKFARAARLELGEITFHWQTVPPSSTNAATTPDKSP